MLVTYLPQGQLAPDFSLATAQGTSITREQFRGRQGLVLVFFRVEAPSVALLKAIGEDMDEYRELNATVLGISDAGSASALSALREALGLPFEVLADAQGRVWHAYTGLPEFGFGVFVLDTYGGVDTQFVTDAAENLPTASQVLEWTRGAQYRCSV